MLEGPAPSIAPGRIGPADFERHYGAALGASCWSVFAKKSLNPDAAAALQGRLARYWPEIRRRVGAVLRPSAEIEVALLKAGAPTRPADIHVPEGFYREAVVHAREIRDRYGFLDLAADSGQLQALATQA